MMRRSAGFVRKRPHKKSRGGCLTCKKKKVKCDEASPACSYCALRKIPCTYPQLSSSDSQSPSDGTTSTSSSPQDKLVISPRSSPLSPTWLIPAFNTSAGQLTNVEISFLHHYRNSVWKTLSFREDNLVHGINRDLVPKLAISKDYLLYAILSISAAHRDAVDPSPQNKTLALQYRTKALSTYTNALSNITWENYETLLVTSMYMMGMVPPPEFPCTEDACLKWISALFSMMQGLRLLASLKWARGIERLAVYPLFRRELRKLPPPPVLSMPPDERLWACAGFPGEDYLHPNPPTTYQSDEGESVAEDAASPSLSPQSKSAGVDVSTLPFRPQELMNAGTSPHSPAAWKKPVGWQIPSPAFLPPALMALLKTLVDPPPSAGPIDLDSPILLPVLHALSPIFLSLYYYHLNPDLYVRIIVLPTFLTPQFLALLAAREPRALVIVGWWFAFVRLVPDLWWLEPSVGRVLQAVSNEVMRCNDKVLLDAMEGAYRVHWEEGPVREEQWSFGEAVDLGTEGG
ncbi:hypothetical protein K458DRAFT_420698 [Lentithecium fluviatile CBS 122367]|uniref:Zn(2)-C6 fungal-type domain-containing protein n=1 Tax=Lentithecium fluviatile CBS 122367 TaxID=1168545 RepID=A0A6G1IUI9_9PLEO|nr:hypothetical protein K458DRAFT_420698 [Lentithecium fluviatile CBS 122367]